VVPSTQMPNSLEFLKSTGRLPLSLSDAHIGGAIVPILYDVCFASSGFASCNLWTPNVLTGTVKCVCMCVRVCVATLLQRTHTHTHTHTANHD